LTDELVEPSLYTTVNGPVPPVIVTFKFVLALEQIVAVPLNIDAVAGLLTVTDRLGAVLKIGVQDPNAAFTLIV
jgi:hypothetical protein